MNHKLTLLILFTALVAIAAGNAQAILIVETTPISWAGICTNNDEPKGGWMDMGKQMVGG